jgi:hypothetical protein
MWSYARSVDIKSSPLAFLNGRNLKSTIGSTVLYYTMVLWFGYGLSFHQGSTVIKGLVSTMVGLAGGGTFGGWDLVGGP